MAGKLPINRHECKRCGACCVDVGRTFWKHGNLNFPHQFYDCDELNKLANNGVHEDDGFWFRRAKPIHWIIAALIAKENE